ncbi:MAG: hypothetical protein ABJA35_11710 [Parafilimonas sp.]
MDCKLEPFEIIFLYYSKQYKAKVEQVLITDLSEKFLVTGKKKQIEIISDRPALRRLNSKKKIKFQAINFDANNLDLAISIIGQIQRHIDDIEHPPYNWKDNPKNKPY